MGEDNKILKNENAHLKKPAISPFICFPPRPTKLSGFPIVPEGRRFTSKPCLTADKRKFCLSSFTFFRLKKYPFSGAELNRNPKQTEAASNITPAAFSKHHRRC